MTARFRGMSGGFGRRAAAARPPSRDLKPISALLPLVFRYRRQLALYRALLQVIYPSHTVRAFLLWTAAPKLMEIDAETLDRSMPYTGAP